MELDRIKRNVTKMVGMNAPETDIDAYIASEGATVDQVKTYRLAPASQEGQDPRITKLQEPGAAQRVLRGVPGLGGALDEIGAGADAAINWATGGRSGEPYEESLSRRRDAIAKSDAQNPVRNTVEAVAGGVASAAALPFFRPVAGNSIMATGTNAAVNAVPAAVATGFTEGEGGVVNRLENAKDFATTAAPVAFAFGAGGQAVANRLAGTPANSIARQADNIGVEVPQFMEGGRASQQMASKMGAIPFVGDDINTAVRRTRDQLGQASERISNSLTQSGSLPREAGEAARGALAEWADDGARAVSDRVYAPVNRAMRNVQAPLTNTQQAVGELNRQQGEAFSPIHNRAIGEVQNALNQPGLSFEGITRLRTRIGSMIDNSVDPENRTARAGLQAVYAGLSRDMEAAVTQQGGQQARDAWQRANAITRQIAERRDTVARLIGANGDKAGEGLIDRIVTMAGTKSSADASRLQQARRIMGADAWRHVAENSIARLGRNQSNEFSPDIFLKNYTQLSHAGRQALFASTGNDNLLLALENLANVAARVQQFNRLGNPSGTGGVVALISALGAAASGDMGATFGTALAGKGVGILMSRPAVIRQVTAHSRNVERFLNGRMTRAALAQSANNLARAVAQETGEDEREVKARVEAVTIPKAPSASVGPQRLER